MINYDFPKTTEDYVHRIGRTARAGADGTSHTFMAPHDSSQAREHIKILDAAKQEIDQKLHDLAKSSHGGHGNFRRSMCWSGRCVRPLTPRSRLDQVVCHRAVRIVANQVRLSEIVLTMKEACIFPRAHGVQFARRRRPL